MTATDLLAVREAKFRRTFLIATAVIFLLLTATLVPISSIDLTISENAKAACPMPSARGPWCPMTAVVTARQFFTGVFILIFLATLAATIRTLLAKRRWFGAEQARCVFLLAVLICGPGLVANLGFKEHFGRARPREVIEFGGKKAFTPPLIPSRECSRNCSFISGEASAMYAPFFALAFLLPRYRSRLLAVGIAAGTLAGAVRIIQGGHFLSDVLFAGVFMALTVSVLHIAVIGLWLNPRRTWSALLAPFVPLRNEILGRVRG